MTAAAGQIGRSRASSYDRELSDLELLEQFGWLVPLGLLVGAAGTLIGAGGGFVLVPILLLVYPHEEPAILTSISLAVVFFNAASGSWAYGRMGRIDWTAGLFFSAATVPGAVLGALSTAAIPRRWFDAVLGALLLFLAVLLIIQPGQRAPLASGAPEGVTHDGCRRGDWRTVGRSRRYWTGSLVSVVVGYVSSLLGIGGGIVHVPALVRVLGFPVHVATATSHFILAIMALAGTIVHVVTGNFHHGFRRTIALSIGVVLGAPVGAWLSNRLRGDWILRGLAVALAFVGMRVLFLAARGVSR